MVMKLDHAVQHAVIPNDDVRPQIRCRRHIYTPVHRKRRPCASGAWKCRWSISARIIAEGHAMAQIRAAFERSNVRTF
jgi:hypothetical protein